MFIWINGEYRNLDQATFIKPILAGHHCQVALLYPDLKEPLVVADQQAPSILEYVFRRRLGIVTSEEALESILRAASGGKRKKRVLRDPEASKRRMSESATRRWAKQRELSPA